MTIVVALAGLDHLMRNVGGFSSPDYMWYYMDCLEVFVHHSQNPLVS